MKKNIISRFFKSKVSSTEIANFTSHLADFIHAGIPLLKSLEMLQKEAGESFFRQVLDEIHRKIRAGESFAKALGNYPGIFSPFYVALIEAGEASGKLEFVLDRLSLSLEKELALRAKIQTALVYPCFIILAGLITIIFLMVTVVPKISLIYEDFGGQFPLLTTIIIAVSRAFLQFGWLVLAVLIALGTYFAKMRREAVKQFIDSLSLRVPWVKDFVLQVEASRFSRTLAVLLEGGVSLLPALTLSKRTIINYKVQKQFEGVEGEVSQGKSFSQTLQDSTSFPHLASHFIWVGESTGNLAGSLDKVGNIFEKEIDKKVKVMTTLLEPLIILVTGIFIGIIVIGLLLPIFEMSLFAQ